jgi:hypothetical protein
VREREREREREGEGRRLRQTVLVPKKMREKIKER